MIKFEAIKNKNDSLMIIIETNNNNNVIKK